MVSDSAAKPSSKSYVITSSSGSGVISCISFLFLPRSVNWDTKPLTRPAADCPADAASSLLSSCFSFSSEPFDSEALSSFASDPGSACPPSPVSVSFLSDVSGAFSTPSPSEGSAFSPFSSASPSPSSPSSLGFLRKVRFRNDLNFCSVFGVSTISAESSSSNSSSSSSSP